MTEKSENLRPSQSADHVLRFWLDETPPVKWFVQNDVVDPSLRAPGLALFDQAADSKLSSLREIKEKEATFLLEPDSSF